MKRITGMAIVRPLILKVFPHFRAECQFKMNRLSKGLALNLNVTRLNMSGSSPTASSS